MGSGNRLGEAWEYLVCGAATRSAYELDAVVYSAQRVFVGFARFVGFRLGVLLGEVGVVPTFHGDHGVVGSGQRLFGTDGVDPVVDGLFVGQTELIEIFFAHDDGRVRLTRGEVNQVEQILTENLLTRCWTANSASPQSNDNAVCWARRCGEWEGYWFSRGIDLEGGGCGLDWRKE